MAVIDVVRKTIQDFCAEFIRDPYLCYTEHGQHALFYAKLFNALSEEELYATRKDPKTGRDMRICTIQKEYPTAEDLGESRRQHWDLAVLSREGIVCDDRRMGYDYLPVLAAIEFGMNAPEKHLCHDIERLTHKDAKVKHAFIVHLDRLSDQASRRDWSCHSKRIVALERVIALSEMNPVELYYAMADGTQTRETGAWCVKDGEERRIA
jgi:hypothetical protein